jgi:magnesium-transporting ATPase (P-type)
MANIAQPTSIPQPIQPVPMSLTNLSQYISFSAPVLVIFFITLFSIMQNSFEKGLLFNIGIVILAFIVNLLKHLARRPQSTDASPFCNVIPNVIPGPFSGRSGNTIYELPSMSAAILSFSSTYLIYPMIKNNLQNYQLIVFLLAITGLNVVVGLFNKCSSILGIALGLLLGSLFGALYYFLLSLNQSNLVYFSDTIGNNTQCTRSTAPSQNFQCKVYKNGELVGG